MQPAQQVLVERFVSWDRIRDRLGRYPAIARAFPLALLERHRTAPPYFCHYMAWRLGVWRNEVLLQRLEDLLQGAARLPNWAREHALLASADYADFWGLVWQLQIAEYVQSVGGDVRWHGAGPDLSVLIDDTVLYVECVTYRKSFGLRTFLEDLLMEVGSDIKLDHNWFMPFSLPTNAARSEFLDRTLQPFLDTGRLGALRAQAQVRWPVKVVAPPSSLVISVEGPIETYDPTLDDRQTGDPEKYLEVILREAVGNKETSNQLDQHRPNLLVVNYLLSTEAQAALMLRSVENAADLGDNLDGFAMSAAGIDARLTRSDLVLVASRPDWQGLLELVTTPLGKETG